MDGNEPDADRIRRRFLNHEEALRFVRSETLSADVMANARRWAHDLGIHHRTNRGFLQLLATAIANGEVWVAELERPAAGHDRGGGGGGTPDKPTPPPPGPRPSPPKPKPNCPASVAIEAKCRILMVGEAKTFMAVDPDGSSSGSYKWTSASGKIALSDVSMATVTVTAGASASDAPEGETLKVVRSQAGCPDVTSEVKLTVFKFTKIKVTVKSTPPNTVRAGFAAPADHVLEITSASTDFGANQPIVLMKSKDREAKLELTATPAGLPIHWHVERNSADHASLGGAGALPTVTPQGDVTKATLKADDKGSFRIRPFVSCTGDNTFDPHHAPICLNLVLANATVVQDKSAAYTANLNVVRTNTQLRIDNGAWGPPPLSAATLAAAGCAMELIADVTGGGADGRLGLDQVFCGLINNVAIRNVNFLYRDTTVAPPTDHRYRLMAVSNPGASTGGTFMPSDTAPVLYDLPLLDSGLTPHGEGADTALMTRSQADPSTRTNRPVGIRFTTRCIDSPGTPAPRTHVANANAVMNGIDYQYRFVASFAFWTNRDKIRGKSDKMAERVYSVPRMFTWEIRGVWGVVWPAGAPATLNATTPHTISISGASTKNPMEDAQANHIEVRPPSGVAAGLSWNAQ